MEVEELIQMLRETVEQSKRQASPTASKLRFHCVEEFVLTFGKPFEAQPCPPGYAKGSRHRACFYNAGRLALSRPNLTYVEGFALSQSGLPIHHAWIVERGSSRVIDITNHNLISYFGVPFRTEYLKKHRNESTIDSLVGDWERNFPILQMSDDQIRAIICDGS